MASRPIQLAVIGCGQIARGVHLRVLSQLSDVRVTVLADTDAQNRTLAAPLAPRAALVESYEQAIAHPDVEAVLISLPTSLHATATLAALRQRKHVYLEKPLAANLADAQAILDEWRRANVTGMIGFNYRFNPLITEARQLVQSGRLGDVLAVRSVFATAAGSLPAWKKSRQTGGGVLRELASHHLDLLPWLLNRPVERISATIRSVNSADDTATVALEFAGGVTGQSFFSFAAVNEDRLEIYGTKEKLAVDRYRSFRPQLGFARLDNVIPSGYLLQRLRSPGNEPSYARAFAEFFSAIRDRRPASPDFEDGFRSLKLICDAEQNHA